MPRLQAVMLMFIYAWVKDHNKSTMHATVTCAGNHKPAWRMLLLLLLHMGCANSPTQTTNSIPTMVTAVAG
jgi:hypothetical protein